MEERDGSARGQRRENARTSRHVSSGWSGVAMKRAFVYVSFAHCRFASLFISTAIYAEKIAAGNPVTPSLVRHSNATERPMYAMAHADVKGSAVGVRSAFDAAQVYAEEAKVYRDELLAKYSST